MMCLSPLTKEQIDKSLQESVSLVHPTFATKKSTRLFLSKFTTVYQQYVKSYNLTKSTYLDPNNRKGTKPNDNPTIKFRKQFKETISYKHKNTCLEYLEIIDSVFPTITSKQLSKIAQRQTNRYFKNKPSFSGTSLSRIASPDLLDAFKDYQENLISYLNPISIQKENKKLNVENYSTIDKDSLNDMLGVSDSAVVEKIQLKIVKKPPKLLQVEQKTTKKVKENLGKDSKFKKINKSDFEETVASRVSNKTRQKFKKSRKHKLKKNMFMIKNRETLSVLESNKKKIKSMPLSLKSVYVSDSSNVRSDFIKEKDSALDEASNTNSFRVAYQTPIKIEFVSNLVKDKNNQKIINLQEWGLLTQKAFFSLRHPVVCRMSYLELQGITDPLKKFNIANKYFILEPNNNKVVKKLNNVDIPTTEKIIKFVMTDTIKYEYSSSNIVLQHNNRNTRRRQQQEPDIASPAAPQSNTQSPRQTSARIAPRTTPGGY